MEWDIQRNTESIGRKRGKKPGKMSVKRMKKNWKNVLLSPLCDRSYGTGSFMLWPRRSLCLVHKYCISSLFFLPSSSFRLYNFHFIFIALNQSRNRRAHLIVRRTEAHTIEPSNNIIHQMHVPRDAKKSDHLSHRCRCHWFVVSLLIHIQHYQKPLSLAGIYIPSVVCTLHGLFHFMLSLCTT